MFAAWRAYFLLLEFAPLCYHNKICGMRKRIWKHLMSTKRIQVQCQQLFLSQIANDNDLLIHSRHPTFFSNVRLPHHVKSLNLFLSLRFVHWKNSAITAVSEQKNPSGSRKRRKKKIERSNAIKRELKWEESRGENCFIFASNIIQWTIVKELSW